MIVISCTGFNLKSAIALRVNGARRLTSTHNETMREAARTSTGRFAYVKDGPEIGKKFGRLSVLFRSGTSKCGTIIYRCVCDCGQYTDTWSGTLRDGTAQSCGCLNEEHRIAACTKHGHTSRSGSSPEYHSWTNMLSRCENADSGVYTEYGGRGIKVCAEWHDFRNFVRDMGARPRGTTLDRIEVNGNYEPANCRWATSLVQMNNRRCNVFLEHDGKRLTIAQWVRETGLKRITILGRLARKWTVARTLTTPCAVTNQRRWA